LFLFLAQAKTKVFLTWLYTELRDFLAGAVDVAERGWGMAHKDAKGIPGDGMRERRGCLLAKWWNLVRRLAACDKSPPGDLSLRMAGLPTARGQAIVPRYIILLYHYRHR